MRGHELKALNAVLASLNDSTDLVIASPEITFVLTRQQSPYISHRYCHVLPGVGTSLLFWNHRFVLAATRDYVDVEDYPKSLMNNIRWLSESTLTFKPNLDLISHHFVVESFPVKIVEQLIPDDIKHLGLIEIGVRPMNIVWPVRKLVEFKTTPDERGKPVFAPLPGERERANEVYGSQVWNELVEKGSVTRDLGGGYASFFTLETLEVVR